MELDILNRFHRRTPRWVRGLKSSGAKLGTVNSMSHPTMGAWIEIIFLYLLHYQQNVAPHDGCVD